MSSYAAALDELSALAPELYTQPGAQRRKFSLDEVRVLLNALGNPQLNFKSILIAGTNGKGSTAATLASILTESGLRTGLYTSPHLERVNERIRIGHQLIPDSDFGRLFFTLREAADRLIAEEKLSQRPSFFESLTALAFLYFAEQNIDTALLEVGLGGRLDATNVVNPALSIITDIAFDHMEWLGDSIDKITREKAGILRSNGILITLPQLPAANQAIGEVATALNVRGVSAVPYFPPIHTNPASAYTLEIFGKPVLIDSPLTGPHQLRNRALAIAAAVELKESFQLPISAESIARGIKRTTWPGRLEIFFTPGATEWVLDVAHNPAGAWALRAGLSAMQTNQNHISPSSKDSSHPLSALIFCCLSDKPVEEMGKILFPIFDKIYFAPIHSPRATASDALLAAAALTGTPAQTTASIDEAIALAAMYAQGGRVVIAGSVYLVGEARAKVMQLSSAVDKAR